MQGNMKYAQHKQVWYDMTIRIMLNTSKYDMIWSMMLCTNVKRERVREKWIKRKHKDMLRGSSTLALHPRLHHRVGFPIHYLPPREPLPKRICYNTRSTKLLSQYNNLHRGQQPTNNHLYRRGSQPTQSPLPKRDPNQYHSDHLYRRGIHKSKEGLQ